MTNPSRLLVLSLILTILAGFMFVRQALKWGFIDTPDARKVHTVPTPRTGGIAMVLGGILTLGIALALGWIHAPRLPWQTWTAGLGFLTMGGLDDRFSFQPRQKVLVFLALAALAAWPWVLHFQSVGIPGLPSGSPAFRLFIPVAAGLLVFWFMAVPNAVNIEDAINGYMGGFLLILAVAAGWRGVNTWIPVGALLGFLLLNWPKAKHFMGDAGSFGGGFLIAEVVLRAGGFDHPLQAFFWTAPISLDVAMGLIRRKRLGMSPFEADRSTCPHHLLARFRGSHMKAAGLLWGNVAVCVCLARWPVLASVYLLAYSSLLVFLNFHLLFPAKTPQPAGSQPGSN